MIVVDASVWVSRFVEQDHHHETSRAWLERQLRDGVSIVGPSLLLAEVAGAISRRTGHPELGVKFVQTILKVPGLRLVSIDRRLGLIAARLAANERLRGADALYVSVAYSLDLPLVSWDQEQLQRSLHLVAASTPG